MTDDQRRNKMKVAIKRLVTTALAVDSTVWYARRKSVLLNPTEDPETDEQLVKFHEAVEAINKLIDEGGDPDAP